LAAYYEFEVNRSPFKARSIFFKALKILGKNEVLIILKLGNVV
jgi:hypothetical protein